MNYAHISYFLISIIDDKHLYAKLVITKTFEYDKPPQIFEIWMIVLVFGE